jgi:hypothetical protein
VQCEICGRKSQGNFCELHKAAYDNLLKKYEAWEKSLKVTWTEYLAYIKLNEFSGLWVKEVAQHFLASDAPKQQGIQKSQFG